MPPPNRGTKTQVLVISARHSLQTTVKLELTSVSKDYTAKATSTALNLDRPTTNIKEQNISINKNTRKKRKKTGEEREKGTRQRSSTLLYVGCLLTQLA